MRKVLLLLIVLIVASGSSSYAFDRSKVKHEGEVVVKDPRGEFVGTVRNALTDACGNIVFIIISVGDEGDQEQKEIAIPLNVFSYDHEKEGLTVNASKEQLDAAPEFHPSDLNDPSFAEKSYKAFGQNPPRNGGSRPRERQKNDTMTL